MAQRVVVQLSADLAKIYTGQHVVKKGESLLKISMMYKVRS